MAKFLNEEMAGKIMELRLDLETMDFLVSVEMNHVHRTTAEADLAWFKLSPIRQKNYNFLGFKKVLRARKDADFLDSVYI